MSASSLQPLWPDRDSRKLLGLILSCGGLIFGASVYSFSAFTQELVAQGVMSFSVVAMGALSQAALLFGNLVGAVIVALRPSGWAGRWTDASLFTVPTLLQAVSCLAVALTGNSPDLSSGSRLSIYFVCWFLIGTGLGAQFNASLAVQKANFASYKQRQLAVALQPCAVGFGAFIWALAIDYFNRTYGFSNSFFLQAALLSVSALRGPWIYIVEEVASDGSVDVTSGGKQASQSLSHTRALELASLPAAAAAAAAAAASAVVADDAYAGEEKEGAQEENEEKRGDGGDQVVAISMEHSSGRERAIASNENTNDGGGGVSGDGLSFGSIGDVVSASFSAPASSLLYFSATVNFGVSATVLSMLGVLASRATPESLSKGESGKRGRGRIRMAAVSFLLWCSTTFPTSQPSSKRQATVSRGSSSSSSSRRKR